MIVVLFSYVMRDDADGESESKATDRMWSIVSAMPGFISYKSYKSDDGEAIAVVRFESRDALDAWRRQTDHRETQRKARKDWYDEYWVQASETFREYRFTRAEGHHPIPREVFLKGARPISPPGSR
ncbi:MAG: antibiotic biosynthesis monooxygenase [Actinomycetota bacterium]|nr:antibiotic biosynthesis monooxygenase [Actinomycetota bacterium]